MKRMEQKSALASYQWDSSYVNGGMDNLHCSVSDFACSYIILIAYISRTLALLHVQGIIIIIVFDYFSLGQFWNVPVSMTLYDGPLRPGYEQFFNREKLYLVTVTSVSGDTRSFLGEMHHTAWDRRSGEINGSKEKLFCFCRER